MSTLVENDTPVTTQSASNTAAGITEEVLVSSNELPIALGQRGAISQRHLLEARCW